MGFYKRLWGVMLMGLLVSGHAHAQATGMLWDDEGYNQLPTTMLADKSGTLERVSYRHFLPEVLNQGPFMTCVGFACAYYMQTAVEAKIRGLKDQRKINQLAFSPGYLYQKIKSPDDKNCQRGVSLIKGLAFIVSQPIPSHSELPNLQCGTYLGSYQMRSAFQIGSFDKIFDINETPKAKVKKLKDALASGFPVVVGISAPLSFLNLKSKTWLPAPKEMTAPHRDGSGHAICIVGYDNAQSGGAFLVVNSSGKNWGENGFCWVRYEDMGTFVRYGFKPAPKLAVKRTLFK